MLTLRKRRLYFIGGLVLSMVLATGLVLYALRQNINLYYTPKQIDAHVISSDTVFRLGGFVKPGTLHREGHSLKINFVITDFKKDIVVQYQGVLPSLFRAGQGIVAEGQLNRHGIFVAQQILAKHDEQYHPPISS